MTTEKDLELARHRMEILRMARQLLNEEYINRRAEDHNKWLADADVAWRTKGIKLPYPPFAPYPTEEQILARAESLMKFVATENNDEEKQEAVETTALLTADKEVEIPKSGPLFSEIAEKSFSVAKNQKSNLSSLAKELLEPSKTIKKKD